MTDGLIKAGMLHWACLKDKCPNPCCGPFGGVSADFASIFALRPSEIALTYDDERRIVELLGREAEASMEHRGDEAFVQLNTDGSCPYWQKGFCAIHAAKPSVCRAYPLYLDMFTGLNIITLCPGIGSGWTTKDELDAMLRALADVYEFHLLKKVRQPSIADMVFASVTVHRRGGDVGPAAASNKRTVTEGDSTHGRD